MREDREKGYWAKKKEEFSDGTKAQSRARHLRADGHVTHVIVRGEKGKYFVEYSVDKKWLEMCDKAGILI